MQKRHSVSVPRDTQNCEQEDWVAVWGSERIAPYRPTKPVRFESKRTLHGVFPDVYFYTQCLQRPHERRPMASGREQVSALFFVAWTQRRLTECFPWATKGSNPPKETLTFKKEFFWQTTSGSLPAGLKHTFTVHKIAGRCGAPQASYDRRRHRNCFQTGPAQAFPKK